MSRANRSGAEKGWRKAPGPDHRLELARDPAVPNGLCLDCIHLRLLHSGRSRFVRCFLAESDPDYPRYPVLPVVDCAGHGPWEDDE